MTSHSANIPASVPVSKPTPKQAILADLHKILFCTTYESAPDNWDLITAMAKALLQFHGLHFFDASEIPYSKYWSIPETEYYFFMKLCPGCTLSLASFEYVAEDFIDFDTWHQVKQAWKDIDKVMTDKVQYEVKAIAGTFNQLTQNG